MFIPIITVLTDVVRLLTFQPGMDRSPPFRQPCPAGGLAAAPEHPVTSAEQRNPDGTRPPFIRESSGTAVAQNRKLLVDIC